MGRNYHAPEPTATPPTPSSPPPATTSASLARLAGSFVVPQSWPRSPPRPDHKRPSPQRNGVLHGRLLTAEAEHAELAARKEALAHHVEDLTVETKKKLDEVDAVAREVSATTIELAHLQQTMSGANQELHSVREEVQALVARKEILEGEVKKHHRPDADDSGQPEEMIADLKKLPTLLENITFNSRGLQSETDALEDVHHYLRDLKLSYDRRTVTAFHTALKINDISQLTVLAGVSGTGKSLLPRRYAEAMGMHFLPIAVEPRWD